MSSAGTEHPAACAQAWCVVQAWHVETRGSSRPRRQPILHWIDTHVQLASH
ncbi:hypothetical protein JYU34_020315 [Plutella xylostella]|uniref:Uncharacterized protein n=1 Tax=Plutella xylostella TaxID=51655 RepID=A0ABQ7PU73_PLUXY|nr:hypothetical protein JYU34_020315 [Plutella xylostella]